MNVLIIGSGGREHVIASLIRKNKKVENLFVLPGNPGMCDVAKIVSSIKATEYNQILQFCLDNHIDYVIVSTDDQLADGLINLLTSAKIKCFGPTKEAARIESSKAYAQNLMQKYDIPTANFVIFDSYEKADSYLRQCSYPIVIKADGLALGKGVLIVKNYIEAKEGLKQLMLEKKFGSAGDKVVIEEFLEGPEVSLLTFCDGKTIIPMVSSMDHKRAKDGDKGLNTGGMGSIAPNPFFTKEIADYTYKNIVLKTLNALIKEKIEFKGCLYFSLMLTKDGVKVIEFNARFGDPESQVVLPLLENDLLDVMESVSEQKLDQIKIKFKKQSACCVVLVSDNYPEAYQKGNEITLDEKMDNIYFAGVSLKDGKLVNSSGRVVDVVSIKNYLQDAISSCYEKIKKVHFSNEFYRKDIGQKALVFLKGEKNGL